MPSWHAIIGFRIAFGFVAYLKCVLDPLGRRTLVDETDVRLWRLKHARMAHAACIYCGSSLPDDRVRGTLTSSVCERCAPQG